MDLLFTKGINLEIGINYECPFGRNLKLREIRKINGKLYKMKKNYTNSNYCNEKFYNETDGRAREI